jgi:hypothetical protein
VAGGAAAPQRAVRAGAEAAPELLKQRSRNRHASNDRAMTTRWIWLVPS